MGSLRFDFKDKHVLVTGGSSGIGKQICEDFQKSGAQVTVWDIKTCPLPNVSFHKVDISDKEACFKQAQALDRPIHFLINNAGILKDKTLFKMPVEDYEKVISTNLNSVFYVTKSLLNSFDETGFKRIINISSIVALYGNFGQTNYVAAKSGVIGLTKVWARELGKRAWTVNAVAPGFIHTDILKNMPEDVLQELTKKIPVSRLGKVEDISNTCLFLCSKEASYINGAVISVDGGAVV